MQANLIKTKRAIVVLHGTIAARRWKHRTSQVENSASVLHSHSQQQHQKEMKKLPDNDSALDIIN